MLEHPLPPLHRCVQCGRTSSYARLRCLSCRSEKMEKTEMPPTATLVTFTDTYMLPWGFDDRFLRFGIVEFADGARATGRLAFEGAKTGMTVRVAWEPVRRNENEEEVLGFVFHPTG